MSYFWWKCIHQVNEIFRSFLYIRYKLLSLLKYELYWWLVSPSTYVLFSIFWMSLLAKFALILEDYTVYNQSMPFFQMFYMCFYTNIDRSTSTKDTFIFGRLQRWNHIRLILLLQVVLTKLFSVYTMFIIFWRAPLYFLIFDI